MQLATPNQGGESLSAAIARRMLSQGNHNITQEIPQATLQDLRLRASQLEPGITITREGLTQQLGYQQLQAASAIERLWPADAQMQLIARETAAKAIAGLDGAVEADSDDEAGDAIRPRG